MMVIYEEQTDVVTIRFLAEGTPVTSQMVDQDIILDFVEDGKLAAIEVLSASRRLDLAALRKLVYHTEQGPLREIVR